MKWWNWNIFKEEEKEMEKSRYELGMEMLKKGEEMWVPCDGFEDYTVSNKGNVFYKRKGVLVKQRELENKSVIVSLRKDNRSITCTVSSLVANSFKIPNRNGKRNVYHINEMNNNRLDNLSYDDKYNSLFKNGYMGRNKTEYSDKDRIDKELAKPVITEVKEIWKDVIGYERWYEVSNLGNIRKLERDGSTKLLRAKATDEKRKGRTVGLRKVDKVKTYQISHLVADAFGLKPTSNNKTIVYHIDGDWNNDCFSNLTYDKRETEEYIREQEKLKDEQELREQRKEDLKNYIEEHKEFLTQAREVKEVTLKDIYDKLSEILEVLKNEN